MRRVQTTTSVTWLKSDICKCSYPLCQLLYMSQLYWSITKGCVMSIDFLSACDHIFTIPNGPMPWQFDTIVTTLLSFYRVITISVVKSCRLPCAPHLLHLFHWRHCTFIRSVDSRRSSHLKVLFPNSWRRFAPEKKLYVAACNRSVVVKSNLTFDLCDEPAG